LDATIADNAGNVTAATQVSFTVDPGRAHHSHLFTDQRQLRQYRLDCRRSSTMLIPAASGLNLSSLVVKAGLDPDRGCGRRWPVCADPERAHQGVHTLDATIAG